MQVQHNGRRSMGKKTMQAVTSGGSNCSAGNIVVTYLFTFSLWLCHNFSVICLVCDNDSLLNPKGIYISHPRA